MQHKSTESAQLTKMELSADKLKQVACQAIDDAATELADLSSTIWQNPELLFEEHLAHKTLTEFLEQREFPVERSYVLKYKKVPNVALLCEYDALPEIGHACGHNLIAEVGVAAALGVKATLDVARDAGREIGTLTLLGTPAEEGGCGKGILVDAGAFQSVDAALMAHPAPIDCARAVCLAIIKCHVMYTGKASHAAAFPWEGINALDAAILAYNNISVLRQQIKPTWRIHGVITNGGTKPNIIPETTSLEYYIRTPEKKDLFVLKEKVEACFQAAATATGCQVDVSWDARAHENVLSNNTLATFYEQNAETLGYRESLRAPLTAGSTDMGNVSHVVPSIHPFYSIGPAVNHTRAFTAAAGSSDAQPSTLRTAKLLAMVAIDVFMNPQLVAAMKDELKEDLLQG